MKHTRTRARRTHPEYDVQPAEVVAARAAVGHTRPQASAVIYHGFRAWTQWERGEREMSRALLELYKLKTGQVKLRELLEETA